MQYPLISEYVRAIQDASNNLDKLAHLMPVLDDHGSRCGAKRGITTEDRRI